LFPDDIPERWRSRQPSRACVTAEIVCFLEVVDRPKNARNRDDIFLRSDPRDSVALRPALLVILFVTRSRSLAFLLSPGVSDSGFSVAAAPSSAATGPLRARRTPGEI